MTKASTEDKSVTKRKNETSFEITEFKRSPRDTRPEVIVESSSNISESRTKVNSGAEGCDEKISKGSTEIRTKPEPLRGETSTHNGMLGEIS
ncbi:hypothetical protein ACOME3_008889 [Neoechinorhynchus agilis]